MIDLIIPTIPGREESLTRCVESFEVHTDDLNVIVLPASKTCGWGWKQGLAASQSPYVALVADDIECVEGTWSQVCMEAADEGLLPCPRVWTPDRSIESQGGDMNAYGHILARHRKDRSPTDFTTVPFMSREQADRIDMLEIQYSCDVWVSYRGRQLGYETVLCHGYDLVHHQHQVGRGAGMDQGSRDAIDTETMLMELTYASHTPTLRAVLEKVKPKRVLEIGAGLYSTPEILDCPSVEKVHSLETSNEWATKVKERVGDDERLEIWRDYGIPQDYLAYDLVFIDGPDTEAERLESIRTVLSRKHPVTVIHDAEHLPYRELIEQHTNGNVEYHGEERQTAVVW